nr:hypothetical protein [Dyadobacter sp. NIV53]
MAFLILLSSTGFGLIEHACMMRGKSVKFVTENKTDTVKAVSSCCAKSKALKESKGTIFKKTSCCKENQKFEKLDVTSSFSQMLTKSFKAMTDGVLWSSKAFVFIISEWILPSSFESTRAISFSSLFHGRSMLSFIQSFLI